jgi:hypothetical protein
MVPNLEWFQFYMVTNLEWLQLSYGYQFGMIPIIYGNKLSVGAGFLRFINL